MPVNVYECMFLLDSSKVAGDIESARTQLHATLEKHHCEILASRPWDERKLAYPVKGHKKGQFYLVYFKTDSQNLAPLEFDFSINDLILRLMILRIEPKWVDRMLAVALDEHALALQAVVEEPLDSLGDDLGGRRRSRRDAAIGAGVEDKD